jgi:hypothetical protein
MRRTLATLACALIAAGVLLVVASCAPRASAALVMCGSR